VSTAELILNISCIKGVGPKTCLRLLDTLPKGIESENQLKIALMDISGQIPRFSPTDDSLNVAFAKAHNMIDDAEREKVHIVAIGTDEYPLALAQCESPPLVLFCKGEVAALKSNSCAIIGSRKSTSHANHVAQRAAMKASEQGITVVSGLALGVDQAAHEGCLQSSGTTVAILGGGLDKIHPKANYMLSEKIVEKGGVLVSEYPLGTTPIPPNFVKRNRIQAGLSGGVLLIQAATNSGSIITCEHALKEGRCLGIYTPSDGLGGDYSGNELMQSKLDSILISDNQSLHRFFQESNNRYERFQRPPKTGHFQSGQQTKMDL